MEDLNSFCTHCGEGLQTDARFCGACGQAVENQGVAPLPDQESRDQPRAHTAAGLAHHPTSAYCVYSDVLDQRQVLGLLGAVLLFVGVFLPFVTIPLAGAQNLFQNGTGDGVLLLGLALASFVFVFIRRLGALQVTGLLSVLILTYRFVMFRQNLDKVRDSMDTALRGNPFSGLGEAVFQSIKIEWGFAVLLVGAIALLGAGVWGLGKRTAPPSASTKWIPALILMLMILCGFAAILLLR